MRLDLLLIQNPLHGGFASMGQSRMTARLGHLANVLRQCPPGPQLRRITQFLGLGTGQMHDPRFVFRQDRVFLSTVWQIMQGALGSHRQCPVNTFIDQPARGVHLGGNLRESAAFLVTAQHPCPLHFPLRGRARMRQLGELFHLFGGQHEFGTFRGSRHEPHPTALRISLSRICSCFNETIY